MELTFKHIHFDQQTTKNETYIQFEIGEIHFFVLATRSKQEAKWKIRFVNHYLLPEDECPMCHIQEPNGGIVKCCGFDGKMDELYEQLMNHPTVRLRALFDTIDERKGVRRLL